ncbi:hypothetical protein [Flammeovirga agarivorans]|uniref:hypothetical protein n=1 Tax=Flammeovirga agarivorans TaxID=2726742 RepID=UPI001B3B2972|nr:hypothetical protein [Flammeovirga agarivorans]
MEIKRNFILLIVLISIFSCTKINNKSTPEPAYSTELDRAATGEWWKVAKEAREGKIKAKYNFPDSIVVTGRHFLDLECPRDEVVAFALYTVHDNILKLSAQLYPLFPEETRTVRLEIQKENGEWEEIQIAEVNELGWSTLFRIEGWDESKSVPYRVRHGEKAFFEGEIRKAPKKDEIVMVSMSCNSSRDKMGRPNYIRNINAIDPDVLFFAGDQHYDHTEHTAGWIMWGTQFKDVIRNRPVITIPDDHDIGQGNLWGEGGIKSKTEPGDWGGYFYDAEYVKQVERCQTSHLPDPYDATPIAQGIGVYYTNYRLGGVDFAIIEDRKFKTGPNGKIPQQGPRPDHIRNPDYDPKSIDLDGLKLLGDRQLDFLNKWSEDWTDGTQMKAVLSQSPFAGTSHIHGRPDNRLHADLDCHGWPQKGRNRALKEIRKSFSVHITGDQHLSTLLHYGIDEYNDGPWSIVSPAIVNSIYGRYWHPEDEKAGGNAEKNAPLPWTGEYKDGFDNKITMYAYANPDSKIAKKSRAAGFTVVKFNKKDRTITAETWDRFADLTDKNAKPYPGWPRTIDQLDNFNPKSWETLATCNFDIENPVVQLIDAETNEALYTIRIQGNTFTPHSPKGKKVILKYGQDKADKVYQKAI